MKIQIGKIGFAEIQKAFETAFDSSPRDVNSGDCYLWVYLVLKYIKGAVPYQAYLKAGDHAFVKIGDLFYDAEDTLGKKSWADLRYLKRNAKTSNIKVEELTNSEFQKTWIVPSDRNSIKALLAQLEPSGRTK